MWRLRLLVRNVVTRGPGILVLVSLVAALVAASVVAMRGAPELAILVGVAVFALVLGLLLVDRLVISFEDFAKESQRRDRIAQALPMLYREIEPRLPLPPVEGWALDPRTLVLVIRTMRAHGPEAVVEFGSGISTLVIGQVAHEIGARLYSFEHDAEWFRCVHAWIGQWGLDGTAVVHHAPLQYDVADGRTWYDRSVVSDALPSAGIGLVFVDGPPSRAARYVRAGALPAVLERITEDVTIVMDDCERPEEREILRDWCAACPRLRLEMLSFEHEVAILTGSPEDRPWVRDE